MSEQIRTAINPSIGLRACVENWAELSQQLREPPRRRIAQVEALERAVAALS